MQAFKPEIDQIYLRTFQHSLSTLSLGHLEVDMLVRLDLDSILVNEAKQISQIGFKV
jgi:hypothetical protein